MVAIGSAAPSILRYFEFQDSASAKFWEILQSAASLTVRFGKIGTA